MSLLYSVKYNPMYILQCRVKCVLQRRGGREGSFPERTGQPLLPPFKASTVYSTIYCAVQQIKNFIIYSECTVHCKVGCSVAKVLEASKNCSSGIRSDLPVTLLFV